MTAWLRLLLHTSGRTKWVLFKGRNGPSMTVKMWSAASMPTSSSFSFMSRRRWGRTILGHRSMKTRITTPSILSPVTIQPSAVINLPSSALCRITKCGYAIANVMIMEIFTGWRPSCLLLVRPSRSTSVKSSRLMRIFTSSSATPS